MLGVWALCVGGGSLWWGASAQACEEANGLAELVAQAPRCAPERAHCFGVYLHIVVGDEGAVQDAAWIARQMEQANKHFEGIDTGFEIVCADAVNPEYTTVEDKAQRDRLGRASFSKGVVHWYVVGHLMNVDEEGEIYGVHWRDREERSHRWIIVSAIAWDTTFAHELGHFFALKHSTYPISIMNKSRRAEPPAAERTFHEDERVTMRRRLRRMVRNGRLVER